MKAIKGVLAEELENSERMLKRYRDALASLPKGSIVEKEIKGRRFHYLAYRKGKKVVFEYRGHLSKKELARYEDAKKLRAKYRKLISDLKKQIVFLRRALHERKRRSI